MRNSIRSISGIFPLSILRCGTKNIPLLPFYHTVSDNELPFRRNYDYPSISRFKDDLEFLLKKFTPISLEKLHSGSFPSNAFHLSFDDGLYSCYDIIAPILKQKGIPSSFFINPGFVDNQDLFHRYKASIIHDFFIQNNLNLDLQQTYADIDSLNETAEELGIDWNSYLETEKPYMTMEQIKSLQNDGFSIGAHSWDHPEFWLLDAENQFEEIRESMTWVNENLSQKIKSFAFPFSDIGVSDEVFERIEKENICDITFGTAGFKKEQIPFHFQRIAMDAPLNKNARCGLKTAYLSFQLKRLLNKHIARR